VYQLPYHRTKKVILLLGLVSILVFGSLIAGQSYTSYKDTPQAPCYASIDFVYSPDNEQRWVGKGDMSINMKSGAIYLYFSLLDPADNQFIYNRRLDVEFDNLDSSRFLFNTLNTVTFEGDTSAKNAPFMRRGLEGGLITYSRFSDVEYFYNINNMLMGVCHVPS